MTALPDGRRRTRPARTVRALALLVLCTGPPAPAAAPPSVPSPYGDRLVHHFDFDEPDNFTPVPKYWVPFETLPDFVVGRFDPAVGCDAPPSFYLGLNGRDVACRYIGPAQETPVRPNSDYLIVARIRPDRLATARARISAFYVDRDHLPIADTQRFSVLVGGTSPDWQTVSVHLPTAPREASSLGLTVRVMQERTWRTGPLPHRYIEPVDVDAGAWFDDILIFRLPRAAIETGVPGNVFVAPRTPVLHATVTDSDPTGLVATVTLTDVHGQELGTEAVEIRTTETVGPTELSWRDLEPGLYHATLRVGVHDAVLVQRWQTFAFLHAPYRGDTAVSAPFGVVLDGPGVTTDQLALLQTLRVGSVKIPLWARSRHEVGFADETVALDALLHDLVKAGVTTLGVFAGPPSELVRTAGDFPRPLLEILADDPVGWRGPMTHVVARYASVFESWQVGGDNDASMIDPKMQAVACESLRKEMRRLITQPELTTPADAHYAPEDAKLPADNLSLTIANDVQPEWIHEHMGAYRSLGYRSLDVFLDPLPPDRYDPTAVLADLVKRVVCTLRGGADRVFLPQPWAARTTVDGVTTEPTREFVAFRTAADLLAEARLASVLHLHPDVTCYAFDSGQDAVLVLWDDTAPPEGRTHVLQLGAADRQIDLWGRATPLERAEDGRQEVRLSPVPVYVDGVEQWLVAFLTNLKLEPAKVEFRIGYHQHAIVLAAPVREAVSGEVHLRTPDDWEVSPAKFSFALPPGGTLRKEIRIRYAQNESAGVKTILADIDFDSEPRYHLEIPLQVEIGLKDIEVWGYASKRGNRLIVRHGVLNRTDRAISFRGFIAAPGRTRQYRVFNGMYPGRTLVVEYAFDNALELSGRTLRLGLREVGGRRAHNIELIAP